MARRHPRRFGAALLAALVLLVLVGPAGGNGGEKRLVARRAAANVPGLLPDEPRQAADLALASERLSPSIQGELAMLDVAAAEGGTERFIDVGRGQVTAAIRTEHLLVTASSDAKLRVWRPSDGTLLGEIGTGRPFVSFADRFGARLLIAADASGRLGVVDLTDPGRPRLQYLAGRAPGGRPPLAIAFARGGADVLALGADGTIERMDLATGRRLSRSTLERAAGALPWAGGGRISLTAARFETENDPAGEERVIVATRDGAVANVDLTRWRGRTLLAAGLAPGHVTSIGEQRYGTPRLILGTSGGLLTLEKAGAQPSVQRGPPITGVALNPESALWIASGKGLVQTDPEAPTMGDALAGGPVLRLTEGVGGLVAIHPGGTISLPGPTGSGLAIEPGNPSAIAAFGPAGQLLLEEGADANHVSRLMSVLPGHGVVKGAAVANPELRSYKPPRSWWPGASTTSGLYLSSAAIDDEFVVAAGQDPLGKAVLLVWDARSGRPLRRLPLSIGGITSKEPNVIGDVALLPRRHLIAAYSTVQQLVAIWSTDTWRLLSTVPVGQLASLAASPDESNLLGVAVPEGEDGEPDGKRSKLIFIDPGHGRIVREVRAPRVTRAGWSPDGSLIATVGEDGFLRFRAADGEREVRDPIHLEGQPTAFAWRPDGRLLAVALTEMGVVLADPASGAVTRALPGDAEATVSRLSWSPDGQTLAAVDSKRSESGEFFVPNPPEVWALGPARLELRMCQITGGPIGTGEWRRLVDEKLPPLQLCRGHGGGLEQPPPVGGPSRLRSPVLAYRGGNQLFAVDAEGRAARIGYTVSSDFPPISFAWAGPALGWASSSEAGVLRPGATEAQVWPCPCSGAAWHEGFLYSVQSDGRALLRFRAGARRPLLLPIRSPLGDEPSLLGFLGNNAVVAALSPPDASRILVVEPSGRVERRLSIEDHGFIVRQASNPAADTIAFVSTFNGGPCYSPESVGVLSLGRGGKPRLRFPAMPDSRAKVQLVSSLQVEADGTVGVGIAVPHCTDGALPKGPLHVTRYQLRGSRWQATGPRGQDVQTAAGEVAILRAAGGGGGRGMDLLLGSAGERLESVASGVAEMVARP